MELYREFDEGKYTIKIKVPLEDDEPLIAEIKAYLGKKTVDIVYTKMDRRPTTICDATNELILLPADKKRIEKGIKTVVDRLN